MFKCACLLNTKEKIIFNQIVDPTTAVQVSYILEPISPYNDIPRNTIIEGLFSSSNDILLVLTIPKVITKMNKPTNTRPAMRLISKEKGAYFFGLSGGTPRFRAT